jgi:hypothetical protein
MESVVEWIEVLVIGLEGFNEVYTWRVEIRLVLKRGVSCIISPD